MSQAVNVDLDIDQGADFGVQVYWTDAGGNAFTVLPPMRMDLKAITGQIVHSLLVEAGAVTSGISYNSRSGLIQLTIDAAVTNTFPAGQYSYDLFITYQDNKVTKSTRLHRLLYGNVNVFGRVTQNV
jgi:hypothetical protein